MEASLDLRKRALAGALALALGAGLTACSEKLDGGAACPVLCPGQSVVVLDTMLDAVVLDTSVTDVPPFGTDAGLLLVARGDTVDTRAVIRFDSLTATFTKAGGDSAITEVDSAYVLLQVVATGTRVKAPIRIDLYDVDTTAADTSLGAVKVLFRPDRLIGGSTLDTSVVHDSIKVALLNGPLLDKIKNAKRLRVGLRVTSDSAASVVLGAQEGDRAPSCATTPPPPTPPSTPSP